MSGSKRKGVDLVLYTSVLLLMTIGVVQVYSSSVFIADYQFEGEHTHYFQRQLLFAAISIVSMLVFAAIDYRKLKRLVWVAVVTTGALLVLVLFMEPINGARRWIPLGSINIQPSELFKYIVVLIIAYYLAETDRGRKAGWKRYILPSVIAAGALLVMLEPDLGTVMVISMVVVCLLFVAGEALRKVALGATLFALAGSIAVFVFGYKKSRIDEFLVSLNDPLQGAYQVKQSILYIGSGGILGKGIGRGSVKLFFLPEVHTDFIFANFAEEGGFIWVTIVLILFFILFWRGIRTASAAQDRFGFFLAFGITIILTTSALINIAVTVNLIPTTGMPLPFVSYGGTSLLISASAVGVLLNISRRRKRKVPLFDKRV